MLTGIDLQLVEELRDNARITYADLAEKLGISTATVSRRIERLLNKNVIKFIAIADMKKIGHTVSAMIVLDVELDKLDDVCTKIIANPYVYLVLTTFGRYDVFIMVHFNDEEGLTNFIRLELAHIEGVRDIETFFVNNTYKAGHAVFER